MIPSRSLRLALIVAGVAGVAVCALAAARLPAKDGEAFRPLLTVVEQLDRHYFEELESPTPEGMAAQRRAADRAVELSRALGARAEPLVGRLEAVRDHVARGDEPHTFAPLAKRLLSDLQREVTRVPSEVPNLRRGATLYASMCAACHGADGKGDGVAASGQDPPPENFHEEEPMNLLSPAEVFDALTFGVADSAMPSFPTVSAQDRWDLAFFLFSLRQPPCERTDGPRLSLAELATSNDGALITRYGHQDTACLRRGPGR